jgi:hypothetical protein
MTPISQNQDGVTDEVADLGVGSAMRYFCAINILAKFVAVLVVSLSLITSSTSPVVALMTIATYRLFANHPVILRKHTPKAKKFKIFS